MFLFGSDLPFVFARHFKSEAMTVSFSLLSLELFFTFQLYHLSRVAKQIYVQANTTEFLQRQRAAAAAKCDSSPEASDLQSGASAYGGTIWAPCPELNGKEAHISSVIDEISKDHKVTVKKEEILLMDDDIGNIRMAITHGHLAFQVQQNVDYDTFDSFQTMLLI